MEGVVTYQRNSPRKSEIAKRQGTYIQHVRGKRERLGDGKKFLNDMVGFKKDFTFSGLGKGSCKLHRIREDRI